MSFFSGSGLRECGTKWTAVSAIVGPSKTSHQCKSFYFNYRKTLGLDVLVQEYNKVGNIHYFIYSFYLNTYNKHTSTYSKSFCLVEQIGRLFTEPLHQVLSLIFCWFSMRQLKKKKTSPEIFIPPSQFHLPTTYQLGGPITRSYRGL